VTALDGAVAFAKVANRTILVAGDLYLDVPGLFHELLHIDAIVLERSTGFGLGLAISTLHLAVFPNDPHTFSATAGSCFQDHGEAHFFCQCRGLLRLLCSSPSLPGDNRNAGA
jgi:hypothetical protein